MEYAHAEVRHIWNIQVVYGKRRNNYHAKTFDDVRPEHKVRVAVLCAALSDAPAAVKFGNNEFPHVDIAGIGKATDFNEAGPLIELEST